MDNEKFPFAVGERVAVMRGNDDYSPAMGEVKDYGSLPIPWVKLVNARGSERVVFLGPGMIIRRVR